MHIVGNVFNYLCKRVMWICYVNFVIYIRLLFCMEFIQIM